MRTDFGILRHLLELLQQASPGIAVGTAVSSRPPHRSVRGVLPHTAPAASRARKRSFGIVSASTKLGFDRSQCSAEPLATRASPESETLVLSSLSTGVSKPKELKGLARLPSFTPPAIRR